MKESVVNPSPREKETSPAYMGWRHSEYTPVVLRTVPSAGTGHGEKFLPSCRAPGGVPQEGLFHKRESDQQLSDFAGGTGQKNDM